MNMNIKKNVKSNRSNTDIIWNTNKEGGWINYNLNTSNSNDIDTLFRDNMTSLDDEANKLEIILNNIKEKVFGKVKFKKNKINPDLRKLQKQKESLGKEIINNSDDILIQDNNQKISFEKEIESLKEMKRSKGRVATVFKKLYLRQSPILIP